MSQADPKEPAWLTAAVDQRLAMIKEALSPSMVKATGAAIVMTTLTEPTGLISIDRWERTCDNCGRYCETTDECYSGGVMRKAYDGKVVITFFCCGDCSRKS